VREVKELAYRELLTKELPNHPFLGEMITEQLRYYPTVTREAFEHQGRITDLMASGKLFEDLGTAGLDPAVDRIMICGSPDMLRDLKAFFEARAFNEGNTTTPGDFVIERAFAQQ
jgi:ferredoxin--NADP+ reductase